MGRSTTTKESKPINKPIKREKDIDPDTGYEWDAPTIDETD
jgi:hypothetical protein